ncbi:MAG: RHS repeat-associated core domain-containing protein [Prevotella sp.]|nr:RHS repeat-associated core domain-containing protein [Prevotella sp.]
MRKILLSILTFIGLFPLVVDAADTYSVGTPNGAFTVNGLGAAEYNVSIDVPECGNATPKIGVGYNSQSGNGLVGFGFNITGLNSITRGNCDFFHDSSVWGVKYNDIDALFLGGKRLIFQNGLSGSDGACYSPEGDPYTQVVLHGSAGSTGCWFSVNTADGKSYEYGNSTDSRLTFTDRKNVSHDAAWYVNKISDAHGDYAEYHYTTSNYNIRPVSISYGKNSVKSRGVEYKILFSYTTLSGAYAKPFAIGDRQGKIDVCLNSVSVLTSGNTLRKYTFSYNNSSDGTADKYYRLIQVDEQNGNGESLSPIKISWNYLQATQIVNKKIDVVTESTNSWIKEDSRMFHAVDINGDGVSDIIRLSPGYFGTEYNKNITTFLFVSLSKKDQYGNVTYDSPQNIDLPGTISDSDMKLLLGGMHAMDFDGDGYNDLVIPYYENTNNSHAETFHIVSGRKFIDGSNLVSAQVKMYNCNHHPLITACDVNEDGKDDIIYLEDGMLGSSYSGAVISYESKSSYTTNSLDVKLDKKPQKIFTGDYNSDGLADIIIFYDGGYKILFNKGGTTAVRRYDDSNSITGTNFGNRFRIVQGDFNGDGRMDFVYQEASSNYGLAINNGDGTFSVNDSAGEFDLFNQETNKDDDRFNLLAYDFDHDGKCDIVINKARYVHHGFPKFRNDYKNTETIWARSTGTSFVSVKSVVINNEDAAKCSYVMLGDFYGDGDIQMANYGGNLLNANDNNITGVLNIYRSGTDLVKSGKVSVITNGLGQTTSISYKNGADPRVYTPGTSASAYPANSYTLPIPLVANVSVGNGAAGTQDIKYQYGGLKLHIGGKGMLGFTTRTTENTTLGTTETVTIDQWDTKRWIPLQTTATTTVGSTSSTTVSTVSVFDNWYKNYFAYTSGQAITDFDGNTTETLTEYDASKGVPTKETVKNDGDNMYRQVEYGGYVQKAGQWMPTTLIKRQKHKDDSDVFSTTTQYTYNDKGDILTTVINAGSSLPLTTTNTYDVYGNVLTTRQTGQGVGNNVKTFVYDSTGRFVVKATESASPAVNTYTYDTWGNVLTECDETNPQGKLTVSHVYDGWGRETSVTSPPATTTTTSYGWGSSNPKKYYILKSPDNAPWVKTWYDNCGREVLVESVGPMNTTVSKATSYNAKGQVYRTTNTTGQLSITETFAYDSRGRVTSDALSSGKTTTYSYGNRSVTATVNGRSYTKTSDAWGNIISSVDPISRVDYQYSSNGQPLQVTASDATTHFEYDAAGNKTSMTDPDAGTTSYTYSADGKILTETDARGIETSNTYDDGGRLVTSVTGNTIITNTYGTTGNAANRLVKTESGGNSIEYTYDTYGRVTLERRKTNEGKSYLFIRGYNDKNQLVSMQYPNMAPVTHIYDSYGNVIQKNTANKVIYKLESYNGLTESSSFNGALTTTHTRDSRGFLTNVSLTKGDDTLESLTTDYDGATGNLMSRQRNVQKEKFWYDELDRLTEVSENKFLKLTVTYLPNGNINGMTDVGMYTYDSTDRPHAVRSVENFSEEISGEPMTTTFNDINKISAINKGSDGNSYTMTIGYGPDCQRWSSVLEVAGRLLRSTVYMGDYEEVTVSGGATRGFCYLGDNVLAVRDNNTVKYYNIFTDNLGSILSVMDETGNKFFDATYSAWGRQEVTTNLIGIRRGYCGHEMLDEFQLINMNGRLYDPMIGRFLSPDNYVQLPGNSQSYNRYSYCLNNPLKYNDPSGELFGIDDIIIGFALFNMANSMMQAAFNGENVWKAGGLSLLSSAASYGIGALFGTAGNFGHELLRAGAHGLASGVVGALNGEKFLSSTVSGMGASLIGSYAQASKLSSSKLMASTTVMGGALAWATGGDFLAGAMQGLIIGGLNFAEHDEFITLTHDKEGNMECHIKDFYVTPEHKDSDIDFLSSYPREKPLEIVSPEFGVFFAVRMFFSIVSTNALSFFTNTMYTSKVQKQMNRGIGEYHSFPKEVEAFEKYGSKGLIKGSDGQSYNLLRIRGAYPDKNGTWHDGYFEFIKDKNGFINHRFFNTQK